jgi:hypothetical protein
MAEQTYADVEQYNVIHTGYPEYQIRITRDGRIIALKEQGKEWVTKFSAHQLKMLEDLKTIAQRGLEAEKIGGIGDDLTAYFVACEPSQTAAE